MAAKGKITKKNFPKKVWETTVPGSVEWGNEGDASANFKLLVDGNERRRRIFDPSNFEVHDVSLIMSGRVNYFTFIAQREVGNDLWTEDDRTHVLIMLEPPIVKGRYCKVDYSEVLDERKYAQHVADLADTNIPRVKSIHTGVNPEKKLTFVLARNKPWPAATGGKTVILNLNHFDNIRFDYGSRKADDGAIVHEIDHAILSAPTWEQDRSKPGYNVWMIEGLADYVRDKLGYQRGGIRGKEGSYPVYRKGKALEGYQTTAHFLMWLEKKRSSIIRELYQALVDDTYTSAIFNNLFGKPLEELVKTYERENE